MNNIIYFLIFLYLYIYIGNEEEVYRLPSPTSSSIESSKSLSSGSRDSSSALKRVPKFSRWKSRSETNLLCSPGVRVMKDRKIASSSSNGWSAPCSKSPAESGRNPPPPKAESMLPTTPIERLDCRGAGASGAAPSPSAPLSLLRLQRANLRRLPRRRSNRLRSSSARLGGSALCPREAAPSGGSCPNRGSTSSFASAAPSKIRPLAITLLVDVTLIIVQVLTGMAELMRNFSLPKSRTRAVTASLFVPKRE